jgi:hypothetical protein
MFINFFPKNELSISTYFSDQQQTFINKNSILFLNSLSLESLKNFLSNNYSQEKDNQFHFLAPSLFENLDNKLQQKNFFLINF